MSNEKKIQIGSCLYTQAEIDAIEEKYGQGFLRMNPHYPFMGQYTYPTGITAFGLITLDDQKRMLEGKPIKDPERIEFLKIAEEIARAINDPEPHE